MRPVTAGDIVTHHGNALQPELTFPPAAVLEKAQLALLEDAAERDRTTARRKSLLRILWQLIRV